MMASGSNTRAAMLYINIRKVWHAENEIVNAEQKH